MVFVTDLCSSLLALFGGTYFVRPILTFDERCTLLLWFFSDTAVFYYFFLFPQNNKYFVLVQQTRYSPPFRCSAMHSLARLVCFG